MVTKSESVGSCVLNINQDYCHDVKNVKREDVRKIRTQNIGRHFTLLMVKKTWSN